MTFTGVADGAGPLLALAAGLLGMLAGFLTELVIARSLPRLGALPNRGTRITTAALTGILCAALAMRFGPNWPLPAFLVLGVLAVQLGRIDLAHHLLPNPLLLALLAAGVAFFALSSAATGGWAELGRAAAGAVILFVVFLMLAVISPNGLGMGDVKLAAPVGLYLGYLGWSQLLYGGALGFALGGLVSAVLLRLKLAGRTSAVAFGPSMLAAALGVTLLAV